MSRIVLANWKASLAPERALAWCDTFSAAYTPRTGIEVVLAVPALVMDRVHQRLGALAGVSLAAQGISPYPQGSYTGSLPAAWLRDTAKFALIGHRERRQYFHETVQDVARQGYEALAEGLQPIVCVDNDLLTRQAAAFAREELEQLLWAWTPETPVALEMARTLDDIAAQAAQVARKTEGKGVLYGGGVTPDNGGAIWTLKGVSGILLGQGCLDAEKFAALVNWLPV